MEDVENVDDFWKSFRAKEGEFNEIIDDMTQESSVKGLATIRLGTRGMQDFVTRSIRLLPQYDLKRTQETIEVLNKRLKEAELKYKPRKKFSFGKARAAKAAREAKVREEMALAASTKPVTTEKKPSETVFTAVSAHSSSSTTKSATLKSTWEARQKQSVRISELIDKTHRISSNEHKEDSPPKVFIEKCERSFISMPLLLGSVRIENVKDCTIYLGPCCTSVYLESCRNCTVLCSSHQLRIHQCHNVIMHVRINGHPIIEDCSNMSFGPYRLCYNGIDTHFKEANLLSADSWNNVVDFRWHKTTKSPNWNKLEEMEWINSNHTTLNENHRQEASKDWMMGIPTSAQAQSEVEDDSDEEL